LKIGSDLTKSSSQEGGAFFGTQCILYTGWVKKTPTIFKSLYIYDDAER